MKEEGEEKVYKTFDEMVEDLDKRNGLRDRLRYDVYFPIKRFFEKFRYRDRFWNNVDKWAQDPKRNPLLYGWYSFDNVHTVYTLEALKKLRENMHGFPSDMHVSIQSVVLAGNKEEVAGFVAWRDKIDTMIEGFEAARDIEDMYYENPEEAERLEAKRIEGMTLFVQHYKDLWD